MYLDTYYIHVNNVLGEKTAILAQREKFESIHLFSKLVWSLLYSFVFLLNYKNILNLHINDQLISIIMYITILCVLCAK